jgi:hypothetical protein
MLNKRRFLQGAAGACAAPVALAQPNTLAAAAPALPTLLARRPSARDWQQFVNETFQLQAGETGVHAVTLQAVNIYPATEGTAATEQFSLEFSCQGTQRIPSGTHELRHRVGECVPLYLASNEGAAQQTLHADFNLLK